MSSFIEAIARHRPDLVNSVIDSLPAIGDRNEEIDLKFWRENKCGNSANNAIIRRLRHDHEMLNRIEDALLRKITNVESVN